ncbi:MAG: DUF5063 domain-containing protein [Bacteroidales bacterium]|nr:DUF5063 domain-containing protein [Bacteroidales bacterium]
MSEVPNHPVYSKNVLEMLTVANEFCLFAAKVENYSKSYIINYLQKVSPLLYIKGALLPVINVENPDANERFVTEEEWESLFNEFRNKFKPDDEFWFIDDIGLGGNEPVKGSLAEHLTDIYQDLKDFILLYQKNSVDAKENAVNSLKMTFETHWGYRLVNATKTLHYLVMEDIADNEENISNLI